MNGPSTKGDVRVGAMRAASAGEPPTSARGKQAQNASPAQVPVDVDALAWYVAAMATTVGAPGLLIVFEGIDGAGKTTQAAALAEKLVSVGLDVVCSKEPTSGPWGQKLRGSASSGRLSPEEELAAFVEDRREHVQGLIRPALDAGKVVILDRYYFSTAAYQGARGMDWRSILETNESFAPQPDVLVILGVEPKVGMARIAARGDSANLFERETDLAASAAIFAEIEKPYLLRIDGHRGKQEITAAILWHLYRGALFDRLCLKRSYKTECEPEYCTYRVTNQCRYLDMGALAPPFAEVTSDAGLTPEEQVRRLVDLARTQYR